MRIQRSIRCLIVTAMIILGGTSFTESVMADPVTIVLGSLSGTVDPITYTTAAGTFTTGPITLSLNSSETSFFVVDEVTGAITAHTVMNVTFNDGTGQILSGVLVIDEEGTLGPPSQPIPMNITNGTLTGAGSFSGTRLRGINTTILRRLGLDSPPEIDWEWGNPSPPPDSPRPPIRVDLPPDFTSDIPTSGRAHATTVPEPDTLVLLGTGVAGIAGSLHRRRRDRKKS